MRKLIAVVGLAMLATACSGDEDFTSPSQREAKQRASTAASRNAQEMHRGMALDYTGDTDTDFVIGMIPHHQGAIDMARAELAHGQDPEARRLAQKIVDTQTAEITQMRAWLARRQAAKTPANPQGPVRK